MSDINIRKTGCAGRVTLSRPKALNSLTYGMAMAIDAALIDWAADDDIRVVVIDAEGPKAFCAGGDIQQLYETGIKGDYAFGQKFWRDEYRLNARIAEYPKPIISFMQGFVMGGGVGIGCHAALRVIDNSTQIAMPECGIGLVPDVGGSLLLARAPGRLGAYLGLTAARMGPGDAIYAGFADRHIPQDQWPALIRSLEIDGDVSALPASSEGLETPLAKVQSELDTAFVGPVQQIIAHLDNLEGEIASSARKSLDRNSPLSMAVTLEILNQLQKTSDIRNALTLEYRFTARAMEHGDLLEGIRAQIIDRDRNPQWKHKVVTEKEVAKMLAPLPQDLTFEEDAQ